MIDHTFYTSLDIVTPQIENPTTNMLNDTLNWMLVSGNFIANGGEQYMTVGNFHNYPATNAQNVNNTSNALAYYYIDDISVMDCTVGVEELTIDNGELVIYPNPTTSQLIIDNGKLIMKEIKIVNVLGECIYHQQITNNQQLTIDVSGLVSGIYFIAVQFSDRIIYKKFVKE